MSSYINVTTSYMNAIQELAEDPGSFQNRGLNAASVLVIPITCAIDTIVGVGALIGAVVTGGCISSINKFAFHHIKSSKKFLTISWKCAITAINPENKIENTPTSIFSKVACYKIEKFAADCSKSDNPVKKHFVSRLSYALLGLTALVTKAVEAIIGLLLVPLATLTLGNFDMLNKFASLTLSFPAVIPKLFISILCTINPKAL